MFSFGQNLPPPFWSGTYSGNQGNRPGPFPPRPGGGNGSWFQPGPGIGPIRRGPNGEIIYFGMPGPQGFVPPPPRWGGPPPRFDGDDRPRIQGGFLPPPPNFRQRGAF